MAVKDNLKNKKVVLEEQSPDTNPRAVEQPSVALKDRVRSSTAEANKGKAKPERFMWLKVWVSFLLSTVMKDRGKIPNNIGDKIMITNNQYITKLYMSTIIQITELGPNTPITLFTVLNNALREKGNKAIIDFAGKNKLYDYDPKNSGLSSRIQTWTNLASNQNISKVQRERANRCLYTVSVAASGVQLKQTRMFLTVRAKDIHTLNQAEKIIFSELTSMGCFYRPAHANIKKNLEYISMMGGYLEDPKTVPPVMTNNTILSQIAPNCGSFNDRKGYYLGMNVLNGAPYYIDFDSITLARNMYVVAPSGVGKTVLAINAAQSAFENGSAVCFMDIKGNEFTNFIEATNGHIISLRPTSTEYINSWVMHKADVSRIEDAESYFNSRVSFSKQQIIILSGIKDREILLQMEELLDEFHAALYISLGAIPSNPNSWKVTENLTPYEVFNRFENYLTPQKRKQYSIHNSTMGVLRMYMSATGTKSYIFKREFDYGKIITADTISFDFGLLGDTASSDIDQDLFRLKFLYMQKLNGEFTTRKYAEGRRTFKILEESQVATPEIMKMYVQEYTLRRSQHQDTMLLGNSVTALMESDIAKPLIENTTGLFVGQLTKDARELVIQQFGLKHLEDLIKVPGSTPRYNNCFVFVNNMQPRNLYPILQVQIEPEGKNKVKRYKVNTPVKEASVMAGQ